MEYVSGDGYGAENDINNIEWFVKLETPEEMREYYKNHDVPLSAEDYCSGWWDCFMTQKLNRYNTDGETYYYLMPFDKPIEVGETFNLDDTVWERIQ